MHALLLQDPVLLLRRRDESSGGGLGCFVALLGVGIVVFLILRGLKDRRENLGAAHRPLGSGPVEGVSFATPYAKCPSCGAAGDKMKHQWDGLRKVTWTCGYCGAVAGVQELRDEELPSTARQRLGLEPPQGMGQAPAGYYPPSQGGMGGMGGLLTGMMIGNMMGGGGHHHGRDDDDWGGGGSSTGGDWGDSGGDFGGGDSGGDWGDSGGGDSGGDWGGGSDF